jgi:hypothetical protein
MYDKKVHTTQYGEVVYQWKEKVRLIECAKNVNGMCVCVCELNTR